MAWWLACLTTKPEHMGVHIFSVCFSSSLFNILMLNYFILVNGIIKRTEIVVPELLILNYALNLWDGIKFGHPERYLVR